MGARFQGALSSLDAVEQKANDAACRLFGASSAKEILIYPRPLRHDCLIVRRS